MNRLNSDQILSIGIIGGGKGGSEILSFLAGIESLKIQYIIDKDPKAAAFPIAREYGIVTASNLEQTVSSVYTDFIIEATGSGAVAALIHKHKPESAEMISSKSALFLFRILDESRRKINSGVRSEIETIRTGILEDVSSANKFLTNINDLTLVMNILSINASIEAARSGVAGAGFSIVAGEIRNMSNKAKEMAESIKGITGSIAELSQKIDSAIKKLE